MKFFETDYNLPTTIGHLTWPLEIYGKHKDFCNICNKLLNTKESIILKGKTYHKTCINAMQTKEPIRLYTKHNENYLN